LAKYVWESELTNEKVVKMLEASNTKVFPEINKFIDDIFERYVKGPFRDATGRDIFSLYDTKFSLEYNEELKLPPGTVKKLVEKAIRNGSGKLDPTEPEDFFKSFVYAIRDNNTTVTKEKFENLAQFRKYHLGKQFIGNSGTPVRGSPYIAYYLYTNGDRAQIKTAMYNLRLAIKAATSTPAPAQPV